MIAPGCGKCKLTKCDCGSIRESLERIADSLEKIEKTLEKLEIKK